jgi:NDP-sugar pyrophosphorylase family protein
MVKADWAAVLKFHRETRAALTVISSIQHYQIPYGVIEMRAGGRVSAMTEKPEYSFPVNTGVYILNETCIDLIPANAFYNMTDLINELLRLDQVVVTYPVNENEYTDIGQWDEYRATVNKLRV